VSHKTSLDITIMNVLSPVQQGINIPTKRAMGDDRPTRSVVWKYGVEKYVPL
jgi:hypothetical protein